MKMFKSNHALITLSIILNVGFTVNSSAQQQDEKEELIVAYYGRPGVSSLGVLGQYPIEELIPIIKAKALEYENVTENTTVIPAFDIIYGLAAGDPGRDKSYILPLSSTKLMPYINVAQDSSFAVFIDLLFCPAIAYFSKDLLPEALGLTHHNDVSLLSGLIG